MTGATDPDAALMLRVKAGDRAAYAELVEKYKQPVMSVVYQMIRDPDEAEDLAQNVFYQVYRSAHRYETRAKFSTWLFTIARNLTLNEIRRRKRHPAESLDAAPRGVEREDASPRQVADAQTFAPPDLVLQQELQEKVEEAVAALPENQRTALGLCRQGDVSYEEISEVLGCSLSATKSLIHRARETLKARLKPYLRTGVWKP